jgi:D-glycero-alpha-D-manno-heptose-7-phosphate kinase
MAELESNVILYYTGTSRVSSDIIKSQSMNIVNNKADSIEAMNALKEQAYLLKKSLLWGKVDEFGPILHLGWINKKMTSTAISNSVIDEIYEAAITAGATGGKISGAGGGGFMMFYCPGITKFKVIPVLLKFGGEVKKFQFSTGGAFTWRIGNSI